MSEDIQVEGTERLARRYAEPHPEDMGNKPRPESAYEALERLPPNFVGEIIDGELFASPRARTVHGRVALRLGSSLVPFDRRAGREGPGGWHILPEPELHLHGDVLVSDLAGWRRERMPELPDVVGVELAPDWLCEVLSPSTERLDRARKMAVYAREGVQRLWLVDPRSQTLEVYRLEGNHWVLLGTHAGGSPIRAEPFETISLELAALWER